MSIKKQGANDKGMKRSTRRFILIVSMFVLTAAAVYLAVGMYYNTRFFPGSYINGVDCSGMTIEEVEEILADSVKDYQLTVVTRGGEEEVIEGSKIAFSYVSTGSVKELQENQNPFSWTYSFFQPADHSTTIETSYSTELLQTAMEKMKCFDEKNITVPADAYIKEEGLVYELIPEVEGNLLNNDKTFAVLCSAINQGAVRVDLDENKCYEVPAIRSTNENLVNRYNTLVKYAAMSVTYDFGEEDVVLDAETIHNWTTISETGEVSFNQERIEDYITALAQKYDTYQENVEFETALGEKVTIYSNDYGWKMDKTSVIAMLRELLESGEPALREPLWLRVAKARTENGIGDTYVEIDYTNQRMWFHKDGETLVDTRIVTGNTSEKMGSPVGIFAIYYLEELAVLKGEDYLTPVDFWMPFYGGVGIHDAKWRDYFGGKIYQTSGSHGCINTPWENAKTIFENIKPGTPDVCYNGPTDLGRKSQYYEQPEETRDVLEELGLKDTEESEEETEEPIQIME